MYRTLFTCLRSASFICKMRGRSQLVVIGLCVLTMVVLLYKMGHGSAYGTPISNTKLPLPPQGKPVDRGRDMENINALASYTQHPVHLQQQKEIEEQILDNIKQMADSKPPGYHGHSPQIGLGRGIHFQSSKRHHQQKAWEEPPEEENKALAMLPHRLVHLDLKGAAPKIAYFRELLPLLQDLGATGLLVEYEDTFPYRGSLEELGAHDAYSPDEIKEFLSLAQQYKLEVIPLVQLFGHMEFILKLKSFKHLREIPQYPQVICPTHNGSLTIIKAIVDQVLELHPKIDYLHIGLDEVYNLGQCHRCQEYMHRHNIDKAELFLSHARHIAEYVKNSYDVQPIMWDDEFRKLPKSAIVESGISKFADIMVWKYTEDVPTYITDDILQKYTSVFGSVWIASSFKGATGPDKYMTDIEYHLQNHKSWMSVVSAWEDRLDFKGIVLTGWQRYDHFSILCELLPAAIPSLAVNLFYLQTGHSDPSSIDTIAKTLKCFSPFPMTVKYSTSVTVCRFPGSGVYTGVQKLQQLERSVDTLLDNPHLRGWMTDYHIHHKFSSPAHVEKASSEINLLQIDLTNLELNLREALRVVYNEHTVDEWIEMFLQPTKNKLRKLTEAKESLLSHDAWPRRPIMKNSHPEL